MYWIVASHSGVRSIWDKHGSPPRLDFLQILSINRADRRLGILPSPLFQILVISPKALKILPGVGFQEIEEKGQDGMEDLAWPERFPMAKDLFQGNTLPDPWRRVQVDGTRGLYEVQIESDDRRIR